MLKQVVAKMRRFDQGSVILSYFQVRRTGKGHTDVTRARLESAIPPYLAIPLPRARARTHTRVYIRARVRMGTVGMLGMVGMVEVVMAWFSAAIPITVFSKRYGFQGYRDVG